jgi:hypothetical protein
MTDWSNLQWVSAVVGVALGFGNLGWILIQGRTLHREERARAELERGALRLIDDFGENLSARVYRWDQFIPVKPELREAALLGKSWGAVKIQWHGPQMLARLANLNDPGPG